MEKTEFPLPGHSLYTFLNPRQPAISLLTLALIRQNIRDFPLATPHLCKPPNCTIPAIYPDCSSLPLHPTFPTSLPLLIGRSKGCLTATPR